VDIKRHCIEPLAAALAALRDTPVANTRRVREEMAVLIAMVKAVREKRVC
jgi:hypothetical protein